MSRSSSPRPSSISIRSSSPQGKPLSNISSQMAVPPPPPVYVRRAKPGEIKAQRPPKHEAKRTAVDKYREDVRKSHNRQSRLHAYIAEDGEVEDDASKLLEAVSPRPRPYSTRGPNYSRDSLMTTSTASTPMSSMVHLDTFPEAEEDGIKEARCCCSINFKGMFKGLRNPFAHAPKPTPNTLLVENRYSAMNLPIFLEPTIHDSDFRVKVHLASRTNSASSLETIVQ